MTSFGRVFKRGRLWWIQFSYRGQVHRDHLGDLCFFAKGARPSPLRCREPVTRSFTHRSD